MKLKLYIVKDNKDNYQNLFNDYDEALFVFEKIKQQIKQEDVDGCEITLISVDWGMESIEEIILKNAEIEKSEVYDAKSKSFTEVKK